MIAHRLSTISHADQIVVLNDGVLEACGEHHDVIRKNKWYQDAVEKQQSHTPLIETN